MEGMVDTEVMEVMAVMHMAANEEKLKLKLLLKLMPMPTTGMEVTVAAMEDMDAKDDQLKHTTGTAVMVVMVEVMVTADM